MLVVMQEGASPDEIATVCQRAQAAGFAATLYDTDPAVVVVAGEEDSELDERLGALSGVAGSHTHVPRMRR